MSQHDPIERPSHYCFSRIEPIDVIEAWGLGFHLGNVVKFFGSGSALLEAFAIGRDCWGVELESRWHQPAVDHMYRLAEREAAHAMAKG